MSGIPYYWAHFRSRSEADEYVAEWSAETGYAFTVDHDRSDGRDTWHVRRVVDVPHANGWCCVDCVTLLANGETPPEMSEAETAEWLARVEAAGDASTVTLGRMFGEDGCEHTSDAWRADAAVQEAHAAECERDTFSWRPCDVCGSTLGGERHAVTFRLAEMRA